jgi:hypothetical protein
MARSKTITLGRVIQRWRGYVEDTDEETLTLRVTTEIGYDRGGESEVTVGLETLPRGVKPVVGQKVVVETRRVQVGEEHALLMTHSFTPLRKPSKAWLLKVRQKLDTLKQDLDKDFAKDQVASDEDAGKTT